MAPLLSQAALAAGVVVVSVVVVACGHPGPQPRSGVPDQPSISPLPLGPVELLWQADGAPDPIRWPTGLALDGQGGLVVVDAGHHQIWRIDGGGRSLARWGDGGDGPGQFSLWQRGEPEVRIGNGTLSGPMAASGLRLGGNVAVAPGGDILVADILNHRIQRFDPHGQLVAAWGGFGHDQGQFTEPSGVAVDRYGRVYVADTGNHRIQQFDGGGAFQRAWGRKGTAAGEFQYPMAVAVDGQDQVYVADRLNYRIQKFISDGTFLSMWGGVGDRTGEFTALTCLAVDRAGRVYATDALNHRVQVFDGAGRQLAEWGGLGSGAGEFIYPSGIAVDARGDVFVADTGNNRIQAFRPRGPWPVVQGTSTPRPVMPTPTPIPLIRLTPVDR